MPLRILAHRGYWIFYKYHAEFSQSLQFFMHQYDFVYASCIFIFGFGKDILVYIEMEWK